MGKLVVIVGMGPGVSAAVARRFGREGHAIAAIARRRDALEAQVAELARAGIEASAHVADAGDAAALERTLATIGQARGTPDVLVYNAAGVRFKPIGEVAADDFARDLQVSVVGAFAAARALMPAMRARGSGTLLFTGGGFAMEPVPAMASLGAGKAALRNLAFSLYAELKDTGVHAATVTICGMVKPGTPFDPDRIAEAYWTLHTQSPGSHEREIMFRG